ncbi:MAG: hypothetical protein MI745_02790, partial [Pseudomonadales bacterium]|nr:hypothetical protein [Pseudomonadales bacterium]
MFYISGMLKTTLIKNQLSLLLSQVLVALLWVGTAFAEESVVEKLPLIDSSKKINASAYISYYEDTSNELTLGDVLLLREEMFTPNTSEVF